MPVFDQRGQQVTYQYNSAGNINFDAIQNQVDVVSELVKLQTELTKAIEANVFNEETATDAEYQMKKAVQQAQKPEPEKKRVLTHLQETKVLIERESAAGQLVIALNQAAEMVQRFLGDQALSQEPQHTAEQPPSAAIPDHLELIRTQLTKGFTSEALCCFCYDTAEFIPVYDRFGSSTNTANVIDELIISADQSTQLETLHQAIANYIKAINFSSHS